MAHTRHAQRQRPAAIGTAFIYFCIHAVIHTTPQTNHTKTLRSESRATFHPTTRGPARPHLSSHAPLARDADFISAPGALAAGLNFFTGADDDVTTLPPVPCMRDMTVFGCNRRHSLGRARDGPP